MWSPTISEPEAIGQISITHLVFMKNCAVLFIIDFFAFILSFLNVAQKHDLMDFPGGPVGKTVLPVQGHEFSRCRGRSRMLISIEKQNQTNKQKHDLSLCLIFFGALLNFALGS